MGKKLSRSYVFLRKLGLNYSEEQYGRVSIFQVLKQVLKAYRVLFYVKFIKESYFLSPISARKVRPWVLRKIGCNVGKDVFIGSHVYIDSGYAKLITLEDHVHIAARCLLLCHQRDLSKYYIGGDYAKLPYKTGEIHLRKGCLIGMNTTILPGVTIGEGSVVGAGSLVTKDIPDWVIATGRPAKVIKQIPQAPD